MKYIAVIFLALFCGFVKAGEIGHGHIEAIKNYNFTTNKSIAIHLRADAERVNQGCLQNNRPVGNLNITSDNADFVNRTLSIALAAHMAGKKVRLYSTGSNCNIEFISIQEIYF